MKNTLIFNNTYVKSQQSQINQFSKNWSIEDIYTFLCDVCNIDTQMDQNIIKPYTRDWSNISGGHAELLVRPASNEECALLFAISNFYKIPITISAGQTNLTGSATPEGGIILSTSRLNTPFPDIDVNNQTVTTSIGICLEDMRNEVLIQSKNKLYYPVDPTSRHDAYVGGTLSCNASGFIPGEKGATRYWVQEIELMLINGYSLNIKRGEYISSNGFFNIQCENQIIKFPVPKYERPKIKNASGPYSSMNHEVDFIDIIIGSEGIFGMILSCTFNLAKRPKEYLELFLRLKNEKHAVSLHTYLYEYLNQDMSQITALEYFGYNCQTYMKHKEFLFRDASEVGVYLQVPIYKGSIDDATAIWATTLNKFDPSIDFDNIIVLNDPLNWKRFFEARHSIPDNALTKTRQLGGVSIITDTIVPAENFEMYLEKIHAKLKATNIEYLLFGHLGDCHLHFHLIPSKNQDEQSMKVYDYMIDLSAQLGGVYSAEHGTGKRKRNDFKKCYGKEAINMVRDSKLAVDPDLLLNKGNIFI